MSIRPRTLSQDGRAMLRRLRLRDLTVSFNQPSRDRLAEVIARIPGDKRQRLTEPIIGYRWWTVSRIYGPTGGVLLTSQYNQEVWHPRQRMTARCRLSRVVQIAKDAALHQAPSWDCKCGIYAVREGLPFAHDSDVTTSTLVVGKVALWGRVLSCERGYRAEHAYPVELLLIGPPTQEARRTARVLEIRYGVPVLLEDQWLDLQELDAIMEGGEPWAS